jgi:hypothetical protein
MIRRLASIMAALLLSGCGQGGQSSPVKVELKPDPVQAYRLNFGFHDLPGPLSKVRAIAFYQVENYDCVKPRPFSGAVLRPDHAIDLPLKPLGDNGYEAAFHRDALRDADYFGLGLCRWKLQNVAIYFSSPATDFTASLSSPSGNGDRFEPVQSYFLHRDYFSKPEPMTIVFGEKAGFYLPDQGRQFRIEIAAEPVNRF